MHTEMWRNPATVANVATLLDRGAHVVGPASGQLTGSDSGPGRMAEPDEIVARALAVAGSRDLAGRRILITAGGTREPLDPVRFIGNRSSGKQGVALARAAVRRGADVTLVVANIDDGVLEADGLFGAEVVHVSTTLELQEATLLAAGTADVVIMAAAVADYRPESVAEDKIKKETQGDTLELRLVKNPDILRELTDARREAQVVVGFAAETEQDRDALLELGRAKAARKGVDYLVVNRVGWTQGFATDGNAVIVLGADGAIVGEAEGSKGTVADRILDVVLPR
jgi:phosphopantothenoylcysteine decarboxylase/phosphopantothenate--cysteine ligase